MTGLRTSGRDPWTFRAKRPEDLLGEHADLIGGALGGEPVEYMLYAPMFDAAGGAFGVTGTPASHAVAVTPTRFLVSEDPHADGCSPTLTVVPLGQMLTVEVGQALVLGWLALRWGDPGITPAKGRARSTSVLFGSSGLHHFHAVLRAYRSRVRSTSGPALQGPSWHEVWSATPPYLRDPAEALLVAGERVLAALRCEERWVTQRRGHKHVPLCAAPDSLLLVTDAGLLWCTSERRARPHLHAFGVNVVGIRHDAIARSGVERDGMGMGSLRLAIAAGGAERHLSIPLAAGAEAQAGEWARRFGRAGAEWQ